MLSQNEGKLYMAQLSLLRVRRQGLALGRSPGCTENRTESRWNHTAALLMCTYDDAHHLKSSTGSDCSPAPYRSNVSFPLQKRLRSASNARLPLVFPSQEARRRAENQPPGLPGLSGTPQRESRFHFCKHLWVDGAQERDAPIKRPIWKPFSRSLAVFAPRMGFFQSLSAAAAALFVF